MTPLGGYPGTDDQGRELQSKRNRDEMLEDFIAAYTYLKNHKDCNGKIGVVGFCFGGWIANMMAVRIPELAAAVPFMAVSRQRKWCHRYRPRCCCIMENSTPCQ
ncbi:dienelactone hydrolase family protein [Chitinophaga pinensis]|uniref:dienelactone hydrolase family protein n=1 Tax=Chitinophaga pinensis TaxID=79329 RepID=UPI0021BDECEF|nr:dienelactone hydrolase family protein [Chitinophaga pinensis]